MASGKQRKPNTRLRWHRNNRGWSLHKVADLIQAKSAEEDEVCGITDNLVGRWERGRAFPGPFYREKLCQVFDLTAVELGLLEEAPPVSAITASPTSPADTLPTDSSKDVEIIDAEYVEVVPDGSGFTVSSSAHVIQLSQTQYSVEPGDTMAKFGLSRRTFLEAVLAGTSTIALSQDGLDLLSGTNRIDEYTLQQFESLNEVCWKLSNGNQLEITEQILGIYLPRITAAVHQSSPYRSQAASLAARGYILAAEVDKQNLVAMQNNAQQAVFYSQFSDNYNVQCDALRQEATIALVAKQPHKTLLAYQKAQLLVEKVSPLLRSRIHLGLASAYARCNPGLYKQESLKYLGLACEQFPTRPEDDPWFLYMYASGNRSVLHLYEALTYSDLHQSTDAWNALIKVDGLHPKMPITESARIEFINLQAKTSVSLGNMDESCIYIEASVQAADASGYSVWREEATEVYQELAKLWPYESKVRKLGKLFQR